MVRFVYLLFLLALAADIYIYRSVICWHFKRLSVHIAYVAFALITDIGVVGALLIYGTSLQDWPGGIMTVMWMVWAFFLTAVPKILFAVGGLLDFLAKFIVRQRSVVFRGLALLCGLVVVVAMVLGATIWRTGLRVTEVEICSPRVPEAFDGYKMAQFSDIHLGSMPGAEKRLAELVERVNFLEPDIIFSTGDLVNISEDDLTEGMMEVLSGLEAPGGVWSVWGNHDLGFYMRDDADVSPGENLDRLAGKIGEMGWRTLSDRSVWLKSGDGGPEAILLTGVDYPAGSHHNGNNSSLAGADLDAAFDTARAMGAAANVVENPDPFNIVLAHTPDMWEEIVARGRGDLTLSGHTHAMQMKIRFWGNKPWSLAQYLYENWSGLYTKNDSHKSKLYVNDGIGTVGYPMRIGRRTRPEITLFTLKRCE